MLGCAVWWKPSSPMTAHDLQCAGLTNDGLQVAADNAVFGQTGPKVGSFDAGYGSAHLARIVGRPRMYRVPSFKAKRQPA